MTTRARARTCSPAPWDEPPPPEPSPEQPFAFRVGWEEWPSREARAWWVWGFRRAHVPEREVRNEPVDGEEFPYRAGARMLTADSREDHNHSRLHSPPGMEAPAARSLEWEALPGERAHDLDGVSTQALRRGRAA